MAGRIKRMAISLQRLSDQPRRRAKIRGLLLALAGATLVSTVWADEPQGLPKDPAVALRMEHEGSFPLTTFYDTPELPAHGKPGDLLRQESFAGYNLPSGASAVRILYRSRNAEGNGVVTSAAVLIPPGTPPAGGWPIIAWAHGTSGVARQCAPSAMKNVYYGEIALYAMLSAGFAVVATDYHGLGTEGAHQYATKVAQAYDVIYSVPAARAAVPSLGQRWVSDGHSQGGAASWAVAEIETTHRDHNYLGAVSVSGAGDLRAVMPQIDAEGAGFYLAYMAYGIRARSPEFAPSDMLAGDVLRRYDDLTTQGCWLYAQAHAETAGSTLKSGWDRTAAVKRFLKGNHLGEDRVSTPLLVITGEADQTVSVSAVRGIVEKACRNGTKLEFHPYPGLEHTPAMVNSMPEQLDWIRERFAGKPAGNSCANLGP
jgi:alpha-beta hydrolase superfamily lysophospholipase